MCARFLIIVLPFAALVLAFNQEKGPTLHTAFRSISKRENRALLNNERYDDRQGLYYLPDETKQNDDDIRQPYEIYEYQTEPNSKNMVLDLLMDYFQNKYPNKAYYPYYYNNMQNDDDAGDNSEQKIFKFLLRKFEEDSENNINKNNLAKVDEFADGESEDEMSERNNKDWNESEDDSSVEDGAEGNMWARYKAEHSGNEYTDRKRKRFVSSKRSMKKRTSDDEEDNGRDDTRYMYMDRIYNIPKRKRFPVTKRSSTYYFNARGQHQKRFADNAKNFASGTDPKVVRDLSHIFGNDFNTNEVNKKDIETDKEVKRSENTGNQQRFIMKKTDESNVKKPVDENNKEQKQIFEKNDNKSRSPTEIQNKAEKAIKIEKKSIDWSTYFGYDKRKKKSETVHHHRRSSFEPNMIDDNWLLEQYHKLNNISRNEHSINKQHSKFRQNTDANDLTPSLIESLQNSAKRKTFKDNEESKLDSINAKLKNMEDMIVHQALKYTGAHEGETDPAEIQEIKDKVMSRLAAAYSLEKMRKALSEFKMSIAVQMKKLRERQRLGMLEEDLLESDRGTNIEKKNDKKAESNTMNYVEENRDSDDGLNFISEPNYRNQFRNNDYNDCPLVECIVDYCHSTVTDRRLVQLCTLHQLCKFCEDDEDDNKNNPMGKCDSIFISQVRHVCMNDVQCEHIISTAALRGSSEDVCTRYAECGSDICIPSNNYAINYGNFDTRKR